MASALLMLLYVGSYAHLRRSSPPTFSAHWRGRWLVAMDSTQPRWLWTAYLPCRIVEEGWRN